MWRETHTYIIIYHKCIEFKILDLLIIDGYRKTAFCVHLFNAQLWYHRKTTNHLEPSLFLAYFSRFLAKPCLLFSSP